ncbi:MAG: EFR1 family ferrodoxin [Spirochaetaceae bacterium]
MTIFYFSGTGNSLWVTKSIKESFDGVKLEPITRYINREINDDKIGFIFPCYCLTVPPFIRKFISELNITAPNPYIFSVITHNGVPGRTLSVFDKLLKKKGFNLNYGDDLIMPGNSVIIKDYTNSRVEVEKRLKDSLISIKPIIVNIKNRLESNNYPRISLGGIIKNNFEEFILNKVYMPKPFWTSDSCNNCGICKKVCPTNSIEIIDKKIIWDNSCVACLACYHWCPKKAIELDKYTKARPRLTHPQINIKEMCL